jgi:hypothetical protein
MTTKAGTAAPQERDMLQLSQDIAPGRVDAIVAQAPMADRWFVGGAVRAGAPKPVYKQ